MNNLFLIEVFLEQCGDGIYIRKEGDDEDSKEFEKFSYELTGNDLTIINQDDVNDIYSIKGITSLIDFDELLIIHRENEEIIYIEQL